VILAQQITALFMQTDSKAGIHWSKTFCVLVFATLLHVHAAYAVHTIEKYYFLW
jgi:hypothetical protein